MATIKERTAPAIHVPPPLILAAGFLAGYGLDLLIPLALHPVAPEPLWDVIQVLLWLLGAGLGLWAFFTFGKAKTGILPTQAVTKFVTHGPYWFSRNPMYTGLTIMYIGFAVKLNSIWPVLLLPPTLWVLWKLVIAKEERFLAEKYGAEYDAFRRRVRRWI